MKKNQFDFLRALSLCNGKHRKTLISNATTNDINSVCEACLNILKGNVPITRHHKQKLKKHKTAIRRLVSKSVPVKKKKIIIQKGGFLPIILGALAPVLGSILGKFINR